MQNPQKLVSWTARDRWSVVVVKGNTNPGSVTSLADHSAVSPSRLNRKLNNLWTALDGAMVYNKYTKYPRTLYRTPILVCDTPGGQTSSCSTRKRFEIHQNWAERLRETLIWPNCRLVTSLGIRPQPMIFKTAPKHAKYSDVSDFLNRRHFGPLRYSRPILKS
jgi:hypothetical protein